MDVVRVLWLVPLRVSLDLPWLSPKLAAVLDAPQRAFQLEARGCCCTFRAFGFLGLKLYDLFSDSPIALRRQRQPSSPSTQ